MLRRGWSYLGYGDYRFASSSQPSALAEAASHADNDDEVAIPRITPCSALN
jgi:hypothetical protein